jgi:hypothetical protein
MTKKRKAKKSFHIKETCNKKKKNERMQLLPFFLSFLSDPFTDPEITQ